MKTYIGTKQVKAEPMDELAAVEKGYARKNEDSHEWRQGYHVLPGRTPSFLLSQDVPFGVPTERYS